MKAGSNLRELEHVLEREIADFWTRLGASEAPEAWENDISSSPPESHKRRKLAPCRDPGTRQRPFRS